VVIAADVIAASMAQAKSPLIVVPSLLWAALARPVVLAIN
jgi:hypothetical protein